MDLGVLPLLLHLAGLVDGQEEVAGEVAVFLPLRLLESELIPCKENRESWRSSGGNYTNHLSTSCFLHELAQQKAIFRLKCFKLQWPWRVWIIWLTADAWCCFKHLDVWQWFLSTPLPQTPARCCFCEWLHLAHSAERCLHHLPRASSPCTAQGETCWDSPPWDVFQSLLIF